MASTRRRERHEQAHRLAGLRRTCEELLHGLDDADDVQALCAHVGRRRGRTIRPLAMDLRATGLHGLWIATDTEDFVVYEARTSRPHQEHIIAHELAHILCGHHSGERLDDSMARVLFPSLDPGTVRGVLGRCGYQEGAEQEAETMATLLLTRVRAAPAEPVAPAPAEAADTLARIELALGAGTPQRHHGS
ncbi:ImmA/IrrE family metallo-endopeptidase [Streptomyces sp. 549]|uniref:ImmA/IrrE family metallo-endopeptidase n=1 Tax=Streptomyces sp. 549 TaxID=3049076 RepID=UPI0024C44A96|nr:ImmA/IrrE family metallo-endopeptidase [Streptomyces sp. 549]MDK1471971.1 ImmA/IrrE family metallo-endopeptidase [Streptomyces sp. 549]